MISEWEKFNRYKINAAAGMPDAQYYLGYCFYTGTNVERNLARAEKWLALSAAQGYREAERLLATGFAYTEERLAKLKEERRAIAARNVVPNPIVPNPAGASDEPTSVETEATETAAEMTREERLRSAAEAATGERRDYAAAMRVLQPLLGADETANDLFERILRLSRGESGDRPPRRSAAREGGSLKLQTVESLATLREIRARAADGEVEAQFMLAECYYYGKFVDCDYDLALKWYRNAAEGGNTDAACQIGNCYVLGNGVKTDYDKAFHWFLTASDAGCLTGTYNLGLCYRHGWGTEPDKAKELDCYRRAAEGGNARAQYELGRAYLGYDKVDLPAAHFWLARACNQDVSDALVLLAKLYEEGRGVNRDEGFAYNLLQKVVRLGGHEADSMLAKYYYRGEYVTQDWEKAAELALAGAEAGDTVNQLLLSRFYAAKGNFAESFRWLKLSSADGDGDTIYELGKYYAEGKGTAPNTEEAFRCYAAAAEAGCDRALVPLANCYKHGLGVARNNSEAVRLAKLYKSRVGKKGEQEE